MTSYYLRLGHDPRRLASLEHEQEWLKNKIKQVQTTKLPTRPSATKEINSLKYQLRHRELEHTFCGPEWVKYEKYAIWDLLTE